MEISDYKISTFNSIFEFTKLNNVFHLRIKNLKDRKKDIEIFNYFTKHLFK